MNPLSAQMPGPEDSAEMDPNSGAVVVSAGDGERLVRFLKVFRPVECAACGEVVAFQHRATNAVYCMDHGGVDAEGSKRMPCYMSGMMGGRAGTPTSHPDLKMRNNAFHSGGTYMSPIDAGYAHQVAAAVAKSRELEDSDRSIPTLVTPVVQPAADVVDGAPSVARKVAETVNPSMPKPRTLPQSPKVAPVPESKPMPKSVAPPAPPAKEKVRRYMWSECAYSPKLANGEPVLLAFTWNATTFLVNSEGDADIMVALQDELMKYSETAKPMSAPPVVGEMVIGQYDGGFYRGRVTEVTGESCKIVFVDYGDQITCKYSEILPANDKIMSYPIYGMTVHLEKLPLDPKVTVKLTLELENAIYGSVYHLEFCNREKATPSEDPVEVRLLDKIAGVTLNDTLQKSLWPQSVAAPSSPVWMWSQCRYSRTLADKARVYVQYQYSATLYHIIAVEDSNAISRFQELLNKKFKDNGEHLTGTPVVDQIVIGRYDEQFYRGRIEKVEGDSCLVAFVDFGDKNTCKYSELFQPNEEIMKNPIYGMMVHMYQVPDPANPATFVLSNKLELILNDSMIFELAGSKEDLRPSEGKYTVEGRFWDGNHRLCVNQGLIKAIQAEAR